MHNDLFLFIVFPKLHQPRGHGWMSFVAQELRANSLIVLLTLLEMKIAAIQKMWPCSVLQVRVTIIINTVMAETFFSSELSELIIA